LLQKLLGNQILLTFFAKFWKKFKQDNPVVAGIIFMVCSTLILYSTVAPDYGLGLPKWLSMAITVAALIVNGANGANTYEYLEKSKKEEK
jgi:membrane-bound ClpP family serine protease